MIITTDELQKYLAIETQDNCDLGIFARWASDYVESVTNRIFNKRTVTEILDWHSELDIVLENYPIISVSSVSFNVWEYNAPVWEIVDGKDWVFSPKTGILSFDYSVPRGLQNIKVVYESGYTVIPADLKLATLAIAAMYYNQRSSNGISEETVWWDKLVFTNGIPWDILSIIAKYTNV